MKWPSFLRALLILLLVLACERIDRPVEPIWGKQACSECGMILSIPRYAAQLVTNHEERLFFDDFGCLVRYLHAHSLSNALSWVRDESGSWVSTNAARFVSGAPTPMDYGFAVSASGPFDFASSERAILEQTQKRQP